MNGFEVYEAAYKAGWRPEPRLTVSEWADGHRVLGNKAGLAAVRWRTSTTPYLREIMDALGPRSPAKRVVFMKGSQLGGTEAGGNWLGYIMHHSPGAILIVRPTVDEARRFSRQRLEPMISTTPVLRELVKEPRARDGGNSVLIKEFPGGLLFLTGSNSATGVKSMPIRWLFCDEVDEYPGDVDGQGDPIALAEKRTTGPTYSRRKVFLVSTPTIKGLSRIEREFLASDQRRYYIPCPHCDHRDWIRWENIRWQENDPKTAALRCTACGELIEERFKPQMLAQGEWRPTAPENGETIGFHLSSLYSPLGWLPWSAAVSEFLAAKDDPMRLKGFVNSVLGETWEERGDTIDADSLAARAEVYPAEVPDGVGILVAAVDVQGDRLEIQVVGFGAGEEAWLIAFHQMAGDPERDEIWQRLDSFLSGKFQHQSGQEVGISAVAVDCNYLSDHVHKFCAFRSHWRFFPVRGGNVQGQPVIYRRPTNKNPYGVKVFTICTDTAKETFYSRLQIPAPTVETQSVPGYIHFTEQDPEYFAQVTAEKALWKWMPGRGRIKKWEKLRDRNEALDLWVYSFAALYILWPPSPRLWEELAERAEALKERVERGAEDSGARAPAPPLLRRPRRFPLC